MWLLQEERAALMGRIQNAGTEVVEAKAGAVCLAYSLAYCYFSKEINDVHTRAPIVATWAD